MPVAFIALLLLTAAAQDVPTTLTFNDVPFGKRETITGIWFSNFENSRFLVCDGFDCDSRSLSDWSSIECLPEACAELTVAARRASNQWDLKQEPSGHFRVRFEGRIGLEKYPSRYIGDGLGRVLIERVLVVKLPDKAASK
jgi:hypothetical protein